MSDIETLRDALAEVGEISRTALRSDEGANERPDSRDAITCTPKALPKELQVRAALTATGVNPVNALVFTNLPADDEVLASLVGDPLRIAVLTSKYWGPSRRRLTVSFLDSPPSDLRTRIIAHLNAWQSGIEFVHTNGTGQVRISRGAGGYWSYVGTDVLHIAVSRPTMNLQGFTMSTPAREFNRVVRHEAGHTLGFPHEHMRRQLVARIDPEKAYEYFRRTQGWTRAMVDQQVLTPLDERTIMGTPADQTSIMCYQLPGEITRDGAPIIGGLDINTTDRTFARRIYPPVAGLTNRREEHEHTGEARELSDHDQFVYEPAFAD